MKSVFRIDMSADTNGTHLIGEISATYSQLRAVLGDPQESDGYKVSGEWVLVDSETGNVYTVYDWKETALYDPDYPSVPEFRTRDVPSDFHIGGHGGSPYKLIDWLRQEIARLPAERSNVRPLRTKERAVARRNSVRK